MGMLALGSSLTAQELAITPGTILATENNLVIWGEEQAALLYRHGDAPFKPYVKTLTTPAGVNVLLDSPPDHVHHRGLMFGLQIDESEFWSEFETAGFEHHRRLGLVKVSQLADGETSGFEETLDWVKTDKTTVVAAEQRNLTLRQTKAYNLLTWKTTLALPPGTEQAVITGHHYYGLGMRFIRSMDTEGTFFNAADDPGTVFRGDERLYKGRWCAYTAQADGHPVTVALFDHPANGRAATWFGMKEPFAYLSATLNTHVESLTLRGKQPMTLIYAIALWDGTVDKATLEQAWQQWQAHTSTQGIKP